FFETDDARQDAAWTGELPLVERQTSDLAFQRRTQLALLHQELGSRNAGLCRDDLRPGRFGLRVRRADLNAHRARLRSTCTGLRLGCLELVSEPPRRGAGLVDAGLRHVLGDRLEALGLTLGGLHLRLKRRGLRV